MIISDAQVFFESADAHFLEKNGFFRAVSLVRRHAEAYNTPFINDTYQLAQVLGLRRSTLFRLVRGADGYYDEIVIQKKSGGKRILHAPQPLLKEIQQVILKHILEKLPVSPYATAYIPQKRLWDNAAPHTGHTYLLKMDITDFFGSITFLQVISSAFPSKMYPPQVGAILTRLCCRSEVLPQGAPTSPMLSNIVMRRFDNALGGWCRQHGITYTRYCDDLTFSANTPLYAVYCKAAAMLEEMGFEVNAQKTRFVTHATRQTVTGLTVNEKVSVPADYKRTLRQELHYAIKFGVGDSIVRGNKTAFIRDGKPDADRYYHHLKGKTRFVLSVEPKNKWFREALAQLDAAYFRV